ncbi:MAG: hypothetical protein A2Y77_04440 [Planctomycetes bacterium RBG_13_62_9]|nr:MAG: hypothetical protein A2Y77_04440 [Planctomycetes bacterium RBG_13_62_9]
MKIAIVCVVAMLTCSCHRATDGSILVHRQENLSKMMDEYRRSRDPCYRMGESVHQFRGPLTIGQVKDELLKLYSRTADLPSGYVPRNWMELNGKYRDGDELYGCLAQLKDSVSQSYLYVLVRGDAVIDVLGVMTN